MVSPTFYTIQNYGQCHDRAHSKDLHPPCIPWPISSALGPKMLPGTTSSNNKALGQAFGLCFPHWSGKPVSYIRWRLALLKATLHYSLLPKVISQIICCMKDGHLSGQSSFEGLACTIFVWRKLFRMPISCTNRLSSLGLCLVTNFTATGVDPAISALKTWSRTKIISALSIFHQLRGCKHRSASRWKRALEEAEVQFKATFWPGSFLQHNWVVVSII